MRLLPRTPRGTWLFASLVWAAATLVSWRSLPLQSQRLAPDQGNSIAYFAADGRWLVVRNLDASPDGGPTRATFHLWDLDTGSELAAWPGSADGERCLTVSPDAAQAVVRPQQTTGGPAGLLDLKTGGRRAMPSAIDLPGADYHFAGDGKCLLVIVRGSDPLTRVWDRRAVRVVVDLPGSEFIAVARDGSWVSRERAIADEPPAFCVRAAGTAEVVARFAPAQRLVGVSFTADGRHLLCRVANAWEVREAATGRLCVRAKSDCVRVLPDGRLVAGLALDATTGTVTLTHWDLTDGREVRSAALPLVVPKDASLGAAQYGGDEFHFVSYRNKTFGREELLGGLPVVGKYFLAMEVTFLRASDGRIERVERMPLSPLPPNPPMYTVQGGGRTLVQLSPTAIWYFKPSRPFSWLVLTSLLWAIPIGCLARRRLRQPSAIASNLDEPVAYRTKR